MKKLMFIVFVILSFSVFANAQATPTPTPTATPLKVKKPIFRATKDQIMQVQKMLKDKGLYKGEATGKMEDDFRVSIKSYQKDNGYLAQMKR